MTPPAKCHDEDNDKSTLLRELADALKSPNINTAGKWMERLGPSAVLGLVCVVTLAWSNGQMISILRNADAARQTSLDTIATAVKGMEKIVSDQKADTTTIMGYLKDAAKQDGVKLEAIQSNQKLIEAAQKNIDLTHKDSIEGHKTTHAVLDNQSKSLDSLNKSATKREQIQTDMLKLLQGAEKKGSPP